MDKQIIGDWKYCPECGCDKVSYKNLNHRCCADCGQEWFTDVDYTDVVRHHLKSSKQPESHCKPSVDNSWHEKGELPPAGTECVIFPRCDKARITYMGNGVACYVDLSNGMEYSCATSSFEFRPIKSEREKFVENACKVKIEIGGASLFEAMYDAGCRFVSKESSS